MIRIWCTIFASDPFHSLDNDGPQGFGGSGENGYLFSGSLGAMVIISGIWGARHSFEDLGSSAKK